MRTMLVPMFWGIKVGMFMVNYGRSIGSTQFNFFREEVREILAHDDNFVALGKHKFAEKIVHFMYVYRDVPDNKLMLTDNDNHEVKYILDAITKQMPCGDHPLMCSIYSSVIQTNFVLE
jgi:hypothetical protein